ncbi:hypothetical protein C8R43DRAFT_1212085 [Mycena crocata]|nr:hypothetical protein C8R43DRAFT_1212085 [Mycena crocata]
MRSYTASPILASLSPLIRRKLALFLSVIFALLALINLARMDPLQALFRAECSQQPKKRVYLRIGSVGEEGSGTTLNHFKHSIVLAGALDSELVLAWNENIAYSTSDFFNSLNGSEAPSADTRKACRIGEVLPPSQRESLVRGYCAGEKSAVAKMARVRAELADCTSILDTHGSGENVHDLNGCIMGWVRSKLALPDLPTIAPVFPPTRPVTVGVHIRWGDTSARAVKNITLDTKFYGSMGLRDIVRVLEDLRELVGPRGVKLTIAMEGGDPKVLSLLNETDYTLLESSENFFHELQTLSNNDILLLGMSSYGVLAHLIAPPGLTIATKEGQPAKYGNTTGFGRNVVYLPDYTPDSLGLAFQA